VYNFNPKKFKKRTRQEKLDSDNRRVNKDNMALRKLVVDLAKANMELGGTGEGSKVSEGEELSTLREGIKAYELANETSCGELPSREGEGTEADEGKEGAAE